MKVDKKLLFFLLIVIIVFTPFCKKNKSVDEKGKDLAELKAKKEPTKIEKPKIVLIVNEDKFYDKDFYGYLEAVVGKRYRELPPQVLSALFDKFVEETRIYEYLLNQGVIFTNEEFSRYLRDIGVKNVNDNVKRAYYRKGLIEKFLSNFIAENIKVNENDAKRYYYKNLKEFYRPAEIRVSQILLTDEKEALKVRDYLTKHPEEFERIAREKSLGVERERGGDMGYFRKGDLPKDIEDVVFSLDQGEISQVVRSPYGYHIFKVTRKKRKRLIAYRNVRNKIFMKLQQKQFEEKWSEFLKKVYSSTIVKKFPENLFFKYAKEFKSDKMKTEKNNEIKSKN